MRIPINIQVGSPEHDERTTMIEHLIESPAAVETGNEEIAIVDNEDHLVMDDITLMEDVETQTSPTDLNPAQITVVNLRSFDSLMGRMDGTNTKPHSRYLSHLDSTLAIYPSCPPRDSAH
jgi:hypothetical protein